MTRALLYILLTVAHLGPLHATAQKPEVLLMDGKKELMFSAPLEAYFQQGHAKPKRFEISGTNLWRGYVGTWEVKGADLYLISLGRPSSSLYGASILENVPLAEVFPNAKAPIKAVWFSGVITIPRGEMLQYVHMGFESIYNNVLYLRIKGGRITGRQEIDNRGYGATRSNQDFLWVMLAAKPAPDKGDWIDARTIATMSPKGTFKTRGTLLYEPSDGSGEIYIPMTPTTEPIHFTLDALPSPVPATHGSHVEIAGSIRNVSGETHIKVKSMRALQPGETMHRADFAHAQPASDPRAHAVRPYQWTILAGLFIICAAIFQLIRKRTRWVGH